MVVPSASDHGGLNVTYESRLIDGYNVIFEKRRDNEVKESYEEGPRAGPEQPPAGHRDCITDITLCKASQCFMISSSRDGVIKVWK